MDEGSRMVFMDTGESRKFAYVNNYLSDSLGN